MWYTKNNGAAHSASSHGTHMYIVTFLTGFPFSSFCMTHKTQRFKTCRFVSKAGVYSSKCLPVKQSGEATGDGLPTDGTLWTAPLYVDSRFAHQFSSEIQWRSVTTKFLVHNKAVEYVIINKNPELLLTTFLHPFPGNNVRFQTLVLQIHTSAL